MSAILKWRIIQHSLAVICLIWMLHFQGVRAGYPHLVCGHLHDGAATGFVLALLDKMIMQNPDAVFIWCAAPYAGLQGQLSARGIAAHGISPAHFIFIDEQHPMQLMAAYEQALQTKNLSLP